MTEATAHESEQAVLRRRVAELEAELSRRNADGQHGAARGVLTLLDGVTDGLMTFDREWRFTYVNAEAARILGRRPEELPGRVVWQDFPELAGTSFGGLCREAMADGAVRTLEDYHAPFNAWFAVRAVPSPGGLAISFVNVTEERRARETLRESEERFRQIADHSPMMVWVTEPDATCTYLSRSWYEFTGQTPETGLGFGWLDAAHPDDREEAGRVFREANARREAFRLDYRLRRQDGEWRWAIDAAAPRFSNDGTFLGYIGSVIDITDRKRAEEALRESEERFRLLTITVPQLIWTATPDGSVDYLSQQWADYISLEPTRLYDWRWQDMVHPEDLPETLRVWGRCIASGEPLDIRHRFRHRTGQWRWQLVRGHAIRDGAGRITRWVGTSTDIEDQIQAELTLARQGNELRRSNDELQRFAYTASHDLQEPLRTVISFTQLLARQHTGKLSRDADQHITLILEAANRMSRLITSLLDYSRVGETPEVRRDPVRLDAALDAALQNLEFAIQDSGAEIARGALPEVRGDEAQLVQLLQNLVSNAIKYRRPEEPPRIRVTAERGGAREWHVRVADDGIGFDPQYAETIFGVFKRLHGRKYTGTGIGLALCRKIVERHGGRIRAEAREGQGATFTFTLPANEEPG